MLPGGCEARVYANATLELAFVYNPLKHNSSTCTFDRSVTVTLLPHAHVLLSQPRDAPPGASQSSVSRAWTTLFNSAICTGGVPCAGNPEGLGPLALVATNLSWSRFQEPRTADPSVAGTTTVASPGDMVALNARASDYAWYSTAIPAAALRAAPVGANDDSERKGYGAPSASDEVAMRISVRLFAETVAHVYFDGAYVATLNNEAHNGIVAVVNASFALPQHAAIASLSTAPAATPTKLAILAACVGLSADKATTGDVGRCGIDGIVHLSGVDLSANRWTVQPRLWGEAKRLPAPSGASAVTWTPLALPSLETASSLVSSPAAWLQATFDVPAGYFDRDAAAGSPPPLAVDLSGARKGHVYLNGFDCGKYWYDGESGNHTMQRYYQLPPDYVVPRGNRIVLFEEFALGSTFASTSIVRGA
jgi:hypothetical protein